MPYALLCFENLCRSHQRWKNLVSENSSLYTPVPTVNALSPAVIYHHSYVYLLIISFKAPSAKFDLTERAKAVNGRNQLLKDRKPANRNRNEAERLHPRHPYSQGVSDLIYAKTLIGNELSDYEETVSAFRRIKYYRGLLTLRGHVALISVNVLPTRSGKR